MIKVIIAEDQVLFREGLLLLLQADPEIEVIGEASNGREACQLVMKHKPDVLVTDIQMPEMDGHELTRELNASYPEVSVIALTMFEANYHILDMLGAGAKGYVMKTANKNKLVDAIKSVHAGGMYFCETTSMKLMRHIASSRIELPMKGRDVKFTELEIKIIQLVCEELSSKEIADNLNIGIKTVESYRNKIYEKIGVRNMAGMVIYAIRYGYYDIQEGKPIEKP